MADIFFAIMFIALLLLILGLVKPNLVIYWGKNKTRKQVAWLYGLVCVISFIIGGIFSPPVEPKENKTVADQPIPIAENNKQEQPKQEEMREEIKQEVKDLTPLEQMLITFEGDNKMEDIRNKVIKAMTLYNVELTDENYSRVGSTLVGARKSFGVKEMDILDYMIENYTPNLKVTFPDMVGIATAILASR